jgi:anti-anti-sigma factor
MSLAKIFEVRTEGSTLIVISLGSAGSLVAGEEMGLELAGLLERIEQSDIRHAVVDLEQSAYFGTSMLQVMAAVWKRVRARGGKMAVCNVSDTGREILHVTRFDTLWPLCASQQEALEAVSSS